MALGCWFPPPGWNGSRNAHREAIWRERLFEPFLRWVNEELAKADAIVVMRTESHRLRIFEEGADGGPLEWAAMPGYDLHHCAYLARAGHQLDDGDPELDETIAYLEIVALRDGETYGRAGDGTLVRMEAPPADPAESRPPSRIGTTSQEV